MAEFKMTAEHKKELEEKLQDLKVNGRAAAVEQIRIAREFGDLSENAEYDIAKEEQAKLEAEIARIEYELRNSVIIEERKSSDMVDFGTRVRIQNVETGKEYDYTVVGSSESDPLNGKMSNESPIGKAVMGRKKGDKIIVKVPAGNVAYKIIKIN